MADKFLLKDLLFNDAKIRRLAGEISHEYPEFESESFISDAVGKFPELELKARIGWIAECLNKYLPKEYDKAVDVIVKALPPANNPDLGDNDFGDFIHVPYGEFVARFGCRAEYLDISLDALYQITQRFSAEDAIRYFINAFPDETMAKILEWTGDSNYHVRRLCSEGTRPKLPWSQKITIDPEVALPILDKLYYDKTRYVTRSVANHLNDFSKIHPDIVVSVLKRWQESGKQNPKEMNYITKHALRTLVKQGNLHAFVTLGYRSARHIVIKNFVVPEHVRMNSILEFSFELSSSEDIEVIVDYIVTFQGKKPGSRSKKVFKLSSAKLKKNESQKFLKRHMLKEKMTTRTIYPGEHTLEIQVNGQVLSSIKFDIKK